MSTFEKFNLPKSVQKAIDDLGFVTPTPIQEKSFSVITSGRDMMGIAQTGTGKTLAYLLPLLKLYKFTNTNTPKIVVLVPTRELVVQVVEEVEKLTKYMSVKTLGIYGGVNINTQKKAVYEGVDILVGTPGRTMDLALDAVVRFDETQKLVIDEFDEMLNLGFRAQLTALLAMMKPKRQNILFSATMTDEVDAILNDYFDFPEEVTLAASGTPLEKITQITYNVPNFNTKVNLLKHLLETDESMERILIFVNNKKISDMLHTRIEEMFEGQFGVIHSNKSQNYRLSTMAEFQEGNLRGLITTDIMARGLDISNISHVINFELPELPELYMHRIGRTGRADATGTAISFVTPREEEFKIEAEVLMNQELKIADFPEEVEISSKLIEPEKDRQPIKFLMKKPKLDGDGAFHEKSKKNKKVNLGGPSKTKKKTHGSVNRNMLKTRDKKRKDKDK
ncbi:MULTISPECIES: DEAD/DEAH box helicase [unclassified Flavobacterium]|jgi:ATP-dependent RNA helicase RhlE|uniref:DEAD/DEAH box helicase n=1 Tax=unclassified Flavobacterium TaxID=196869 RepID=UPI00070A7CA4|nr:MULTISPECIES: DEAD/DEAH box helicase [unclassified Flavobacterium]KRD58369.1 DEAD/DEAH box helicase [Flavobacterium sp. Root935]MDQ1165015.1 ATP-dependent RNA helicase RhlE [Flavobacterium sp. SORGH_AS_0622]BDU25533.1 DEAD/DEAH box helicase [Flavobacterium sp. GSB-24]